ncbi:anaerobic sulfatase maturase [Vibrio splendidus]|uniref:Anaerobic sulfatase maturase n=1 Tax=Vibrio splendidus TaxID=29497 RepID=A0ABD5A6Z5_VIBSP|nr:anaerobic sulfatase maturase [Vibrio splendidus]MDP2488988.1 anaerobic sulfatase maturase [Vibrio splendidus]PMO54918.1 anaerobic sulfatase maturase [Vibrio splendidus]
MKTLTILVKPSSDKCNLKCQYCFYHDVSGKRETKDYGFMSFSTAKNLIDNALSSNEYSNINFAFQGGEPSLIGLPFFKKFVDYANSNASKHNKTVLYSFQTNGVGLSDQWLAFFQQHDFLIGLSLDGDKFTHDKYRICSTEKGSYERVIHTLSRFRKKNIRFNILSVVTSSLAHRIKAIYPELKSLGATHLQFIPCLEPWGEVSSKQEWSLTAEAYGCFLSDLFVLWKGDVYQGSAPDIRYFNNIIGIMFGYMPESCDMRGVCAIQNVVEADGSIYPCDFYTFESKKIGHVSTHEFENIHTEEAAKTFLSHSFTLPSDCRQCMFQQLCRTGCRRHNESEEVGSKNRYCESYLYFFNRHIHELEQLAEYIYNQSEGNNETEMGR